ncbi:MAG: aliphatic sulfonate ABC transporter substrate-binding protein [Chloroflexota bacterium]|nr:aliphatic sulfonate ABC transporter substrate-binding protein [Chloroflexota bacterium]
MSYLRSFTFLAILALTVTACGGAAKPPASAPPATAAGASSSASSSVGALEKITDLRLDYAYYSPPSLVLKKMGWVEQAFPGTNVKWVLSAGSAPALNYLQANAVDFGSTAGSAALLSRANGNPIKVVYIYEQPEWTALVVAKSSTAKSITDLRGKKVSTLKGTDPYFFMLRTLHQAGMSQADIQFVDQPYAEGQIALERGQVDGWVGLDPLMAASELHAGSKLIYRNKDFNTYGFLNAREDFLKKYPNVTKKVIELYERARKWVIDHPDDTAQILSDAAQVPLDVAKRELTDRMVFTVSPVPGETQANVLRAVIPIIQEEHLAKQGVDLEKTINDLIDPQYAQAVVK